MTVAERVRKGLQESSWIRRMFETGLVMKQQHGADKVFDLTLGNPVVEPPPAFHRELARLCADPQPGMHRYMENAGYPAAREAVAAQLQAETGVPFQFQHVVMTSGAAAALNVILTTLLEPGDEVILFKPFFAEYLHYVASRAGVARVVPCHDDFLPDLDALAEAIGERTRAVLINSPNNPTGVVYDAAFMERLARVLESGAARVGHPIYLLSDEPYRHIVYEGARFTSPVRTYRDSIITSSHSKDLAIPGERIGYIAMHPDCEDGPMMMDGFIYCNRTLGFVNAPALMQRVVSRLQGVVVSVADYQRKRDLLHERLTALGFHLHKPQGAFYLFPASPIEDELKLVEALKQELVLVVPGRGFGTPGYFRVSYCVDDRTIAGALKGFERVAHKLGMV